MINIECASCGVVFGINDNYHARRREDHAHFHCPNGHDNHYPAPKVTPEQEKIGQLERSLRHSSSVIQASYEREEDWKRALRRCPICLERVTQARSIDTITLKIAEHLRDEHGARQRMRAITERATA